ncbi:hypothetical protein [Actinomyces oris]|nr:hypothetical protein [Actinomyces oris]
MNNNALLRLQVRLQQAWIDFRDGERGQTMVEYAGIALVAAAIIVAVITFLKGQQDGEIGSAITKKIKEAIEGIQAG